MTKIEAIMQAVLLRPWAHLPPGEAALVYRQVADLRTGPTTLAVLADAVGRRGNPERQALAEAIRALAPTRAGSAP